jgi:hypothetical protein
MAVRGLRGVIGLEATRFEFADAASFALVGRAGGEGDAAVAAGGGLAGLRAAGATATGAVAALVALRVAGRGGEPAGGPAAPLAGPAAAGLAEFTAAAAATRGCCPAGLSAGRGGTCRAVGGARSPPPGGGLMGGGLVSATAADPLFGQSHDQLCSEAQVFNKTKRLAKRLEARRFCCASPSLPRRDGYHFKKGTTSRKTWGGSQAKTEQVWRNGVERPIAASGGRPATHWCRRNRMNSTARY